MAEGGGTPKTDDIWDRFKREIPSWYPDAKLGIMVSWGPYSVPAWAEPIGEQGTMDEKSAFEHNPYAEWYWNTIRISTSPAAQHHQKVYNNAPYDDFLDTWKAEAFDPDEWAALFASAGAKYVVPLSKHCDGVPLWDAPGTGTRNTVYRGPKRDLLADIAGAVRRAGLRFGVYYCGGLDWSISRFPPVTLAAHVLAYRPTDAAYAMYAHAHVTDLIARYAPDVLWNDIEWPDAGKRDGPGSLADIFDRYYAAVPYGVVNDRWGRTHADFATSEYRMSRDNELAGRPWENCRGVGYSFGYNQLETDSDSLTPAAAVRYLVDTVSRGGNLLLNVGVTAAGAIPPLQRRVLEGLAAWMAFNAPAVHGTRPAAAAAGFAPTDDPVWVRWTATPAVVYAHVDPPPPPPAAGGSCAAAAAGAATVRIPVGAAAAAAIDLGSAELLGGGPVTARPDEDGEAVLVDLPPRQCEGLAVVAFRLR